MEDTPELQKLRMLFGEQRLADERQKGREAEKIAKSSVQRSTADHIHNKPTQMENESKPSPSDAFNRDQTNHDEATKATVDSQNDTMSSVRKAGTLSRFSAPWSDSEDSEEDDTALEVGKEAAAGSSFCPLMAVSRFPYKYLGANKRLMEDVADAAFNNGKFWQRKWTVFQVNPPHEVSTKPLYLVPREEVDKILHQVSLRINRKISFPSPDYENGFCVTFDASEPKPRLLGTSRSRDEFNALETTVSVASDEPTADGEDTAGASRASKAYMKKIEAAVDAARAKKSKSKTKSKADRTQAKRGWYQQLCRAQQYLGLRQAETTSSAHTNEDLSGGRGPPGDLGGNTHPTGAPSELDVNMRPAYSSWKDVVLLTVDVEAHERMPSVITEIGICTLDTRDIRSIAPGPNAQAWRDFIEYRHFRIEEHKHHRNSEFIAGCPDRFEKKFGTSELVRRADIVKALALTCKPPFHKKVGDLLGQDAEAGTPETVPEAEKRQVVLIGHDLTNDTEYLRKLGFDILHLSGLVDSLDTSVIYRALQCDTSGVSLGRVLQSFDITAWNLHNAGNDAGYTLQALLAMAVEHLSDPRYRDMAEELARRREGTIEQAAERYDRDAHEWLEAIRQGS